MNQLDETTPSATPDPVEDAEDRARERSLQLGGGSPGESLLGRYFGFLSGVREELGKVTWPTRRMVVVETVVVLVFVVFFTAMITGLDRVFAWVFNKVLFGG